jgi:hypothetical protein
VIAEWLSTVGAGWLVDGLPWIGVTVFAMLNIATVRATWDGTAGMSPVTWTIWLALNAVALASLVGIGGWTPAAAQLVPVTVVCAVVSVGAVVRYRDAEPGVAWQWKVDVACGVGAVASLAALLVASDETALVLTIVTDAVAAIPTLTMAWWPSKEAPVPTTPFTSIAILAACTLVAGPADWWQTAYPLYLLGLGVAGTAVIVARRRVAEPAPMLDEVTARDTLARRPTPPEVTDRLPDAALLLHLIPAELHHERYLPAAVVANVVGRAWQHGHRTAAQHPSAAVRDPLGVWPGPVRVRDGGHEYVTFR